MSDWSPRTVYKVFQKLTAKKVDIKTGVAMKWESWSKFVIQVVLRIYR